MPGEPDQQNAEEERGVLAAARGAGMEPGHDGTFKRAAVVYCVHGRHATGRAPQKHYRNEKNHFGRHHAGLVSNVSKRHAN